jgi:hypothetical protein
MTNEERFAGLLDAIRMISDAIPDDAEPADLRWRNALRGLLLAFDPNPPPTDLRAQQEFLSAVLRHTPPH